MAALYSNPPLADVILSEANGQRSRENVVVTQTGAEVLSGTVMMEGTAGKWVPYVEAVDPDPQAPVVGVLYSHLYAATGDKKAVGIARDAEVKRSALKGLDATSEAGLLELGIVVRDNVVNAIHTPAL